MDAHARASGRRPLVSIIILNYNGGRWIEDCLTAVPADEDTEVIVVDNASTDGSAGLVRERFPRIKVVELGENLGFAAGNNRGVAASSGDLLAFLNNDTRPAPGWLSALITAFVDESVGLTTAQIVYLDAPDVVDSAGDGYLRAGGAFKRRHGQSAEADGQAREVFGACGAAFMIRRSLFEALDGFDEDFFMVYEDVDLSFRARLRGYRCIYVPAAVVHHAGSGTLGKVSARAVYFGQRNLEWTYLKNMPRILILRSFPAHVLYVAAAGLRYGLRGHLMPYLRAKWDALAAIGGVLRKRRGIQRARIADAPSLWQVMDAGWIGVKRREKRFDLDS